MKEDTKKAEARNAEERKGCTLSDNELALMLESWASKLAESGGKKWVLQIPVNFNNDPDMLMCEAAKRLRAASLREAQAVADYKERVKAAINKASTYSRKNHGIAAQTEPRVYYFKRSEILELLDTTN
jgi:hypothetical protein